jgi:hypothetical protein
MFLVRRAAGVAKLKDVPRPDAFSVITTRKASHPKGRSGAKHGEAVDRLSMVIFLNGKGQEKIPHNHLAPNILGGSGGRQPPA